MKKEELFYTSRDGETKIQAFRYEPEDVQPWAIVQVVHGMAEHIERYEPLAKFLTDRGIILTGENHLGHGKSVSENGKLGYFCRRDPATVVVRDVHRLKKMNQEKYPGLPYFILGHSMGSFITRNYLGRYGSGIDGVIIMGSGLMPMALTVGAQGFMKFLRMFFGGKHISKLCDKLAFGSYNARIENPRTGYDWLTCDEQIVDKYIADPWCGFLFTLNGLITLMEFIKRAHSEEYVSKIPKKLPVFIVAGEQDPVGNYGEVVPGLKAIYDAYGIENVEAKCYEGARHEILNDHCKEEVMKDIYAWLQKVHGNA